MNKHVVIYACPHCEALYRQLRTLPTGPRVRCGACGKLADLLGMAPAGAGDERQRPR